MPTPRQRSTAGQPHSGRFVSYYRVSTQKQGASGLGLEAQKAAVRAYLNGGDWSLVAEHTEVESGKDNDRPALAAAMCDCRLKGATLIIAKLDRLSRNAAFLLSLQDSSIAFVCADMPAANRLTVGILAVIAEHEREMISQRTKDALAAAKARGVKLGGLRPNHRPIAPGLGSAGLTKASNDFAARVGPLVAELRSSGLSLRQIAAELIARDVQTMRGGEWTADAVKRLLDRHAGRLPRQQKTAAPEPQPLEPDLWRSPGTPTDRPGTT